MLIKARVDLLSHFAKCKNKVSKSDVLQEIDFGTITIDLEINFEYLIFFLTWWLDFKVVRFLPLAIDHNPDYKS